MFTYSNATGTTTCTPCPKGEYSTIGSTSCIPRPSCTKSDYKYHYTECKQGKRSLVYELKQPVICDVEKTDPSAIPKDKLDLPCPECPPGLYRDDKTNQCTRCAGKGQLYDKIEKKCTSCQAGSAAIKHLRYDQNYFADASAIPSDWFTVCGSCTDENAGWSIIHNPDTLESYLQSAIGEGSGEWASLTISANLYTQGRVTFEYEVVQAQEDDDSLFSFIVNYNTMVSIDRSKNSTGTFTTPYLGPGNHSLIWSFDKYGSHDDAHVNIKSIIIEGEVNGAADKCQGCLAGFYCEEATDAFKPCLPGQFSPSDSNECFKCPAGTFNDRYARGNACPKCPEGTHSDGEGSTDCENDCNYAVPGTHIYYDLHALEASARLEYNTFGPFQLNKANDTSTKLYFSLCNRFNTTGTSFCRTSRIGLDQQVDEYDLEQEEYQTIESHACIERDILSFDMGHYISYGIRKKEDDQPDVEMRGEGFQVQLISKEMCIINLPDGDNVADVRDAINTAQTPFRTVIDFECNPEVGRGQPVLTTRQSSFMKLYSGCEARLKWESISACPICTIYDYEQVLGECKEDGYRYATYYPKSKSRCNPYGTLPHYIDGTDILVPANHTSRATKCPICTMHDDVEVVNTKCVDGTYTKRWIWKYPKNCSEALSGFTLPEPQNLPCEEVDISRMTAITLVTLAVMVFSIMCIGYVVLYRRHQRLYRNYQILQATDSKELDSEEDFEQLEDSDGEDDLGFDQKKKKKIAPPSSDDEQETRV